MVFLLWSRPSPQKQKACLEKSGGINYDSKYKGFTTKPASQLKEDKELSEAGFFINHARILVGSGLDTYEKGKVALENWRHFAFDWAFVDPTTPIRKGVKFCVCTKTFLPWTMMPLEVVYVDEKKNANKAIASFGFGSGTFMVTSWDGTGQYVMNMCGYLYHFMFMFLWINLNPAFWSRPVQSCYICNAFTYGYAGEERFSIELDENDQVWYEVLSFSKPGNILSVLGYPYVQSMQKRFTHLSTNAVLKHLSA
ncbi:UPF0548 protein [Vitis vinifera]|uniref:UPF0548 protein n=1 Tax=Vitis vinifera TaxID=29760 RepID=A0A438EV13_VITVI|nr:UPF0548 protein [Vitis vinifera]